MQLQQEHIIRLCHMTTRYAPHPLILFNFRLPAPAIFGLERPSTHQCTIQKIPFWDFLDALKPNPTPGHGSGFICFFLTHPHIQRSVFFPLPSAFPFLPLSFPFPTHNFFFLFWGSCFGTSSFFGFPSFFFVSSFYFLFCVALFEVFVISFYFILCLYLRFLSSLCFFFPFFLLFL